MANLLVEVDSYLRGRGYPSDATANRKRVIRKKAVKFLICGDSGKLVTKWDDMRREVILERDEQLKIVAKLHDGTGRGHFGRNRTRDKVQASYYWDHLTVDVDQYVKTCVDCQRSAVRRSIKWKPPMHSVPVTDVWDQLHMPASSGLTCHALRLRPGEELKSRLDQYVRQHRLSAAFVLSCVGSLRMATLRMADSTTVIKIEKNHKIVSLVGTLSAGGHLHVCLSDEEGRTVGGHLVGDAIIFTTAEVVIGELPQLEFDREPDSETGCNELVVKQRSDMK